MQNRQSLPVILVKCLKNKFKLMFRHTIYKQRIQVKTVYKLKLILSKSMMSSLTTLFRYA